MQPWGNGGNPNSRAQIFLKFTLPADCWKVTQLTFSGKFQDQGWGGTGATRIRFGLATAAAGSKWWELVVIDRNDGKYPDYRIVWSLGLHGTEKLGAEADRDMMAKLTKGDEITMAATTPGWSGWACKAEGTVVEVEYIKYLATN